MHTCHPTHTVTLDPHLHPVRQCTCVTPTHPTHPLSLNFYSRLISSAGRLVVHFGGVISHSRRHSCPAIPKLLPIVSIAPQTYPTLLQILLYSLDQCVYILL